MIQQKLDCWSCKQKRENQQIIMPILRPSEYSPIPKNMVAPLHKKVAVAVRRSQYCTINCAKTSKTQISKKNAWEDVAKQAGLSPSVLIFAEAKDCNPNLAHSLRSLSFTRCFLLRFGADLGDCPMQETSVERTGTGNKHFDWFILWLMLTTLTI